MIGIKMAFISMRYNDRNELRGAQTRPLADAVSPRRPRLRC
jgi:hypothetical protein